MSKKIILMILLTVFMVSMVSSVSAGTVLKEKSSEPILPENLEDLNTYPTFMYREGGGAIDEVFFDMSFLEDTFIPFSYNGDSSTFVIGLAKNEEGSLFLAIVDNNLKGQFSKTGQASVKDGVADYTDDNAIDVGDNYAILINSFVKQRSSLPQDHGIVLLKVFD